MNRTLSPAEAEQLFSTLKTRFEKHTSRHPSLSWTIVQSRLDARPETWWSLAEMERTGGEPDVIGEVASNGAITFFDCAKESPSGRRSICYDKEALEARKEHKPWHSAVEMAKEMGITMLDEQQYRYLQEFGPFDTKTSSWLATPNSIHSLGGALFGDFRYNAVFIYHNGVQSYYAVRGFRGLLTV